MLDTEIILRDIFYILFGLASLISVFFTVATSRKRNIGDETERIVRIDENMRALREDVKDIKVELRQTRSVIQNHEHRITALEQDNKTLNAHVKELMQKK